MAKGETHVLPSSYIANSRFTDDCFCHMRNNVCELAQYLREGLAGRLFLRPDGRHIEGGFPHKPIDYGRKENKFPLDQALDTRFDESVGMYQACHEDDTYRLNALHVFGTGYILRNAAMFCVTYKNRLQLLIDSVISTMLPKFKITVPADPDKNLDPEQMYYELNVAHDPTTPKENEFYVTIASNAMASVGYSYYAYSKEENRFKPCATLDPNGTYYTKSGDGFVQIVEHTVGEFRGKDVYIEMADGSYKNLGNAWDDTNPFGELVVVIPGLTRNNTYTNPGECKLFRQIVALDTDALRDILYVDCTNENIELLKNYVNILIKHYRTVLVATHRRKSKYREIVGDAPFTMTDLLVRINYLVYSGEFAKEDGTHIEQVNPDDYCIRDLKLKVNELVDAINKEAFFLKLIDESDEFYKMYNLDHIIEDFLAAIGFNEAAWDDLIASAKREHEQQADSSETVHEFDGYCYNDLGFVYNPYEHTRNYQLWKTLDFTKYGDHGDYYAATWRRQMDLLKFGTTGPRIRENTDEYSLFLTEVLDLLIIADVWRSCNYIGSMYVLDCTLNMLDAKAPDGELWMDGLINPRVELTPYQEAKLNVLYAKIVDFNNRIDLLMGAARVAALTVADLGLRVSDYSVIYTCE